MNEPKKTLPQLFGIPPLYYLLIAFPIACGLRFMHANELALFAASCLAIIPLAGIMGRATESLAESMGPAAGGLLNATFGNAAELIIALLALRQGEHDIVKASITGSIIGNVLLVLGLSILVGGLRYPRQTFNRTAAGLGTTMMALAAIGLMVPTIFFYIAAGTQAPSKDLEHLSEEIAIILAIMYVLSLFFTLKTHHHLFAEPKPEWGPEEVTEPEWSRAKALTILVIATAGVALMSEFLVGSVEEAAKALGMTKIFVGVIVVAIIGNAAEHSTAVLMALKDKMDLSVTIAVGSSIQVAMFVAPALVLASVLMGDPMDLHFTPLEVVSVTIAMGVMALVSQDGESHWMEGALLLAVYVILGLAFYHLPAPVEQAAAVLGTS
ncbi:MAG: calcium/proton exchanger [Planctomycetota bacterium]